MTGQARFFFSRTSFSRCLEAQDFCRARCFRGGGGGAGEWVGCTIYGWSWRSGGEILELQAGLAQVLGCRICEQPYTLNPKPQTLNPKPYTLNALSPPIATAKVSPLVDVCERPADGSTALSSVCLGFRV